MKMRIKITWEQWEHIIAVFFVFAIVTAGCIMMYSLAHQGGWYCEYCHQGSIRGKYEVEHNFGNTPCKYSADSCHHFKYYMERPIEKPKYVK